MAAQTDRGVPLSTLCPKYLHSNSTSHTWPFSAIAELIDNAYDPDVNAKQFWIDKSVVNGQECLTFMDNGNGLDHDTMHKMLSFGYSDKVAVRGVKPIGMYGNGFKSGSMRLGKDAIVFSKSKSVSCVGMLSQTYLEKIGANQISVPIVCFDKTKKNDFVVREEHKASLKDILDYSPFKTEKALLDEVNAISTTCSNSSTGTRIIIWNLCRTSTKPTEFDFEKDRYDIRIPPVEENAQHSVTANLNIPESLNSLRAYCSILYQKPRMQIIIRKQKVDTQLISKNLAHRRTDHYKPTFLEAHSKRIPITFGYNTKSKDQYGIMMYYKNRLIRAYERVGCQLKADKKGVGVIGVIDCYFLEPTHNKQSFNETDKYRKTMTNLGTKLEEYWKEMCFRRKKENPTSTIPVEDTLKRPDQNWTQCDECLKWRKLPDGIDVDKLPEKWFCNKNPDPPFRSCLVEEEAEDSEDEKPYLKTYKQQEKEDRKAEEEKRRKMEEAKKHAEEKRLALLEKRKEARRRRQTAGPVACPAGLMGTPTIRRLATSGEFTSRPLAEAAYSPSSNSGLPVISAVCSLSPPKRKIRQPATPETTLKKTKINWNSDTSTLLNMRLQSYRELIDDNDDDDTDEDISLLETASTPKPIRPSFCGQVKMEPQSLPTSSSLDDLMLWECNDDDDDAPETSVAGTGSVRSVAVGTSPTPAPPLEVSSSTTQTEGPKVKMEEQFKTEEEERASIKTGSRQSLSVDIGVCTVEPRSVKLEISGDTRSANPGTRDLQNRTTHSLEQDMLKSLQEPLPVNLKKERSHQATQTEETEEGPDYKDLFEKAKQKIDELIREKELLLTATRSYPSIIKFEEDSDDMALHVDRLMREVDERTKERDELLAKVDRLEMERNMEIFCMDQQQQETDEAQEWITAPHGATGSTEQTNQEETGSTARSGTNSVSDTSRSLIELRHNIGRLLVSYVPALDLGQVNYECNVIDEILEQVLSNAEIDGGEPSQRQN